MMQAPNQPPSRRQRATNVRTLLAALAFGVLATSCQPNPSAPDLVVFTQIPIASTTNHTPQNLLDLRYPPGSRVVAQRLSRAHQTPRVLSADLLAAGSPSVAPDGKTVLFCGKASASDPWQIYLGSTAGQPPRPITSVTDGAMDGVFLPDGRIAYCSPVPLLKQSMTDSKPTSIRAQSVAGGAADQLTHGLANVSDLTVLRDGRILFVSTGAPGAAVTNFALFTVQSDGTEVAAYAGQHGYQARISRPRELPDRRILLLEHTLASRQPDGIPVQVHSGRPSTTRAPAFPEPALPFRSVEAGPDGAVLASMQPAPEQPYAIYVLGNGQGPTANPPPALASKAWHCVEANLAASPLKPTGRLSTIDTNRTTATLLCLDANHTSDSTRANATRVRISTLNAAGEPAILGDVRLQKDGSFLAEVPSDTPLGFETLNAAGEVLYRLPPSIWARPGENRACVGCHEPHNRSPENLRPLAVRYPAAKLGSRQPALASTHP